jgi:hypothetical protein
VIVLSIDPGEKTSGYVVYDRDRHRVLDSNSEADNESVLWTITHDWATWAALVCEKPAAMGQPLSSNLVETTIWAGAFWAASDRGRWHWLTRNQIKVALCGRCQGVKDSHVACAAQERFGGRKAALGTKKEPGPCYGVAGHSWQALAACLAWVEIELQPLTGGAVRQE